METTPKTLAELDTVAWSSLTHAYGEASDLPGHLQGLSDNHWEERAEAYAELISKVWHQGDVYEATAPALPFLVDMMCGPVGPTAYFAGAILALVAKSAFAPLVVSEVSDNAARRQCRDQLVSLGATIDTQAATIGNYDPRSMLARKLERLATDAVEDLEEAFEEAYVRCEEEAQRLNSKDEKPGPIVEFARWLDENQQLSRRGQVFALSRAQELAIESPYLVTSALERITADHLQHEKRVIEALVELSRGHRESALEMALEIGQEWLATPEAGGLNQSVSRQQVLSLLEHFSNSSAQKLQRRVREADEPEYVIPDW